MTDETKCQSMREHMREVQTRIVGGLLVGHRYHACSPVEAPPQPVEPTPGGYPNGSLADEVLRIVFAFDKDDSRRDDVRILASRVSNLEAGYNALKRAEPVVWSQCVHCGQAQGVRSAPVGQGGVARERVELVATWAERAKENQLRPEFALTEVIASLKTILTTPPAAEPGEKP